MKKLGQHFLTSKIISKRIADVAEIAPDDIILEIGPGKGILTESILSHSPKKLIAVEKDRRFVSWNMRHETSNKKLELVHGDILEVLPELGSMFNDSRYKIVANIPYYLTSHLLRLIFSQKNFPDKIVLMVQREVAERITARPPHMNLLTLSVQAYGSPKIAFRVSRKYFKPQPKVDSAVIVIDKISRDFFQTISKNSQHPQSTVLEAEGKFFKLLRVGFGQKRKMLIKNLRNSTIPNITTPGVVMFESFDGCGIDLKARAENLGLEDWSCLLKQFISNIK